MKYDIHNTQYCPLRRCFSKYVILNRHQNKYLPVNTANFKNSFFVCPPQKWHETKHTKQLFFGIGSLRHQIITCLHMENQIYFS